MEPKAQTPNLNEAPVKKETPIEHNTKNDENLEPKKEAPPSNAKSFFNNKETSQAPQKIIKAPLVTPSSTASNTQSGMFNNFKIVGISSLNPYQNKLVLKLGLRIFLGFNFAKLLFLKSLHKMVH